MGLSTYIFGNTAFGVRFPAALLGLLSFIVITRLLFECFDIQTALIGLIISISIPATTVLSYIMTIDAPLVFFWTLSLYFFWKALHSEKWLWWVFLGISNGLGLLTKQTMAGFFAGMFLVLLFNKENRRYFLSLRLYLSVLISFLMFLPVIFWNMHHDWVTLIHTSEHFTKHKGYNIIESLKDFFEFIGSQLGIISIIFFPFFFIRGFYDFMNFRDPKKFYFAAFSFPFLCMVIVLAFFQGVNANWPAPFYVAGIAMLAGFFGELKNEQSYSKCYKKLFNTSIILGFITIFIFYSVPFLIKPLGLKDTKLDPTKRLRGFQELAIFVDGIVQNKGLNKDDFFYASTRRKYVSGLAFYLKDNPYVLRWTEYDRPTTQYEIWDMWRGKKGKNALFVLDEKEIITEKMEKSFERMELIDNFNVNKKKYKILMGYGYRGRE